MEPIPMSSRILSVQSHVVSGYCGNKSATFPLQLLEFEVDVVNTVQLSNHTQYKVTRGQIFNSKDLEDLHSGLQANNLLKLYDGIISGYTADVSYLVSLARLVTEVKKERSALGLPCWYTLDPVLGDDGLGFYVPGGDKIAEAYKAHLLPIADIITPNRFEASILSGVDIDASSQHALAQSLEAISSFHKMGVQIVVLTSFESVVHEGELVCLLSYSPDENGQKMAPGQPAQTWCIRIPKLSNPFTGTGDLFTSLITGWLQRTDFDFKLSLENTANSIHEILEDTMRWYKQVNDGSVQSYELRLIQNRHSILNPKVRFTAEKL